VQSSDCALIANEWLAILNTTLFITFNNGDGDHRVRSSQRDRHKRDRRPRYRMNGYEIRLTLQKCYLDQLLSPHAVVEAHFQRSLEAIVAPEPLMSLKEHRHATGMKTI
jgi:hypothetical protein